MASIGSSIHKQTARQLCGVPSNHNVHEATRRLYWDSRDFLRNWYGYDQITKCKIEFEFWLNKSRRYKGCVWYSHLWDKIKELQHKLLCSLGWDGNCLLGRCGGQATSEWHHIWYSVRNLTGEGLEGLMPVCHQCHTYLEYDEQYGWRLSPFQKLKRLYLLMH